MGVSGDWGAIFAMVRVFDSRDAGGFSERVFFAR